MESKLLPSDDDRIVIKSREILMESGNCAQTSFVVLQEEFDLEGDQILKALTPFPGIALRGETCGAVIGSLMALGLEFGRDDLSDWRGYIGSLPSARRFCTRFEEENGSTNCATILEDKLGRNFDLADRTEALEYASSGGLEACSEVVASAVMIASEAIRKKR
ncbi:MAG: C_GCAxxG_C_C family protein [Anaerolineales bacterium]|nr:C_GCAxxG_C_C family protein [Anaerolineales bacterium]